MEKFHGPEELWHMYIEESNLKTIGPKGISALAFDYYDESQIGQRRKLRYYQEKAV